jgi:outer membrane protein TolC
MTTRAWCLLALTLAVSARPAAQQTNSGAGAPGGEPARQSAPGTPLSLSLLDAIHRGLEHNLSTVLQTQEVEIATGVRLDARSAVLPRVTGTLRQSEQILNTAAFGFSGFGGLPSLIGPFGVFDARLGISAPILDTEALRDLHAKEASLTAAQADYRDTRETVILAVANLYLEVISDDARAVSARSQVATAEALERLAEDRRAAGIAAQIDVLRQQVQVQAARARVITADNTAAKRRLQLAHGIGLPPGTAFTLSDPVPFSPMAPISLEAGVAEALAHRDDLRRAEALVEAAQLERQAAGASALPSLHFDGDIGVLGPRAGSADRTFTAGLSLHVPVFQGGATRARIQQTEARLQQRQAELEDLRGLISDEVAAAQLDLTAAEAGVEVARSAQSLAREELAQAEDRFRAGVATSIELVEAQQSVSQSDEQYIASVYAHNLAKATLVRAMGEVEERLATDLGGQP